MDTSAVLLIVIISGLLVYLVLDQLMIPLIKGKNILSVRLRNRTYKDQLIFAALLLVLFFANQARGGGGFVNLLLLLLTVILLYNALIRSPKARFKEDGFFVGPFFTNYDHVKNMRLSEDGVLVIDTDRRRMLLFARKVDDLEKILHVFVAH